MATQVKFNQNQQNMMKWFAMKFDVKTKQAKKVKFVNGVDKFNAMTRKNLVEKQMITHDFNSTEFWLTEKGCQWASEWLKSEGVE